MGISKPNMKSFCESRADSKNTLFYALKCIIEIVALVPQTATVSCRRIPCPAGFQSLLNYKHMLRTPCEAPSDINKTNVDKWECPVKICTHKWKKTKASVRNSGPQLAPIKYFLSRLLKIRLLGNRYFRDDEFNFMNVVCFMMLYLRQYSAVNFVLFVVNFNDTVGKSPPDRIE
jgi:hypothetical protein